MNTNFRTGSWRVRGARALFELARPELEEAARARHPARGPRALGPFQSYLKGSALRARPAMRHALRHLAGLELPRLREFANLEWLRFHGFLAARPLLAGVSWRAGLPRYQFLLTELVREVPTLSELFLAPGTERGLRSALLATLARDVARLHGLGFAHRDLFPRNLLAIQSPDGPRCAFLDAWRGGPGPGLRGPEHDLGCLFLDGAQLFEPQEQRAFLDVYRAESERAGRHLGRSWPARVERARAGVYRREARRRPGLAPEWRFPQEPRSGADTSPQATG
jgi:hypothetical protein